MDNKDRIVEIELIRDALAAARARIEDYLSVNLGSVGNIAVKPVEGLLTCGIATLYEAQNRLRSAA